MSRLRFQERQRQAREQEIVDATRQLLFSKGYHSTSMDEVAETVGISKATLYQHFPSKDDLVVHLIVTHLDELLALLDAPGEGLGPTERLTAALRYMIEAQARGSGPDLDAHASEVRRLLCTRPECAGRYERVLQQLTALVEKGQRAGAIHRDLLPTVVVHGLFGLSCVASNAFRAPTANLDAAAVGESIVRLFLQGARSDG